MSDSSKLKLAILRILREERGSLSSIAVTKRLKAAGFELSPRTVRLYFGELAAEGLVASVRRGRLGGCEITPAGHQEVDDASASERVGLMGVRMENLACRMSFDPALKKGNIVLNLTLVSLRDAERAIAEMMPVFEAGMGMGRLAALFVPGEQLGRFTIPEKQIGIGTVCSVTVNGALLHNGIPTYSRFGGVLELSEGRPVRFTDVIHYEGTSIDPLEIFIKGGLTSVREAVSTGHGRICASFREVPACAAVEVEAAVAQLEAAELNGVLMVGKPNQPLLGFGVPNGRTAIIVTGGLNPAAAVYETGIPSQHIALAHFFDFGKLVSYQELPRLHQTLKGMMTKGSPCR